jgi:hypothetical protein
MKNMLQFCQKRPITVTVAVILLCIVFSPRFFSQVSGLSNKNPKKEMLGESSLISNSLLNGNSHGADSPIASLCPKDHIPLFHLPVSSGAKCIDGSQPAFYYRQSSSPEAISKWHIHFEGGGWCWDLPWCNNRADTYYGSSKSYPSCLPPSSMNQKDIFSTDPRLNPHIYNWQTVHVKYCDGTSYASNSVATYKNRKLYFKGQLNRDTTILYLLHQLNMRNATEILISGCSAGGLAVYMGIDRMADLIHSVNPRATVRGLALSGFFADYSALEPIPTTSTTATTGHSESISLSPALFHTRDDGIVQNQLDYANALRHVYTMTNMSAGIHMTCVKNRGVNCVFAKTLGPFVKTPVFSIQPQYDSWQLLHVLSKNFSAEEGHAFGQTLQNDMRQVLFGSASEENTAGKDKAGDSAIISSNSHRKIRGNTHKKLQAARNELNNKSSPTASKSRDSQHPLHGLYIESCAHHCFGCNPEVNEDAWNGDHIRAKRINNIFEPQLFLSPPSNSQPVAANRSNPTPLSSNGSGSAPNASSLRGNAATKHPVSMIAGEFTPAMAFHLWYQWTLKPTANATTKTTDSSPPPVLFLQDAPFPCHDCCRCTAFPLAASPPSLLSALAAKAVYVVPPELQA